MCPVGSLSLGDLGGDSEPVLRVGGLRIYLTELACGMGRVVLLLLLLLLQTMLTLYDAPMIPISASIQLRE